MATDARARPPRRRADAQRNIESILDAATTCLAADPDTSVAEIAAAAGVGRITLYGHFSTRAQLVDAVLSRVLEDADAVLGRVDTAGDPITSLARLAGSSWQMVERYHGVRVAAERELPPGRVRRVHHRIVGHLERLVERGRAAGSFRTDLPTAWLVTTWIAVVHAAAEDVTSGRLRRRDAAGHITATLLAAFTPPGRPVPSLPSLPPIPSVSD